MILSIPYQALEIGNIHLSQFELDKYGKAIARLSYKDTSIDFHDVSILSPPVKVIDYTLENSRLRLDVSEQFNFQVKLFTLQEYLISTFYVHRHSFLNQIDASEDTIRELFHFLLNDSTLSLYIFPTTTIKKSDNTTCKVSELSPGDTIRFVIRLQGISQINNKYGMKFRLQHQVSSLWHISK